MYRKIIVFIVSHFCCLIISHAQDSIPVKPELLFGIYTGYSRNIIRDEVASPLLYKGGCSPLLIEYNCNKSKSRHDFKIFIGNSKLNSSNINKSGFNTNYSDNLNISFCYSYRRNVKIFQRFNVRCSWGGTLLSVFNYRNFYLNGSNSFPFFEQINSLGANFLIEKSVGSKKNDFTGLEINLPFLAYVTFNDRYNAVVSGSLKKYDLNDDVFRKIISNGEFVTFNKLFEFQTELYYAKFLTEHVGLRLENQLHFYSIAHYSNLLYTRYITCQYLIGLIVKL